MHADYWQERWRAGRIGFHRAEPNPLLVAQRELLKDCTRVLVPLCGKSPALEWLVVHGLQVVGVELSELAAKAFFSERGLEPTRREQAGFIVYEHGNVAIWVGDFFATSSTELAAFDAVYDEAALIALPPELRPRYAAHVQALIAAPAKLLLITFEFDAPGGPPFSVSRQEVDALYDQASEVRQLTSRDDRADMPGLLERGATYVQEVAYAISFGRV